MRVDFYLIPANNEVEHLEFTCRIIEKAYLRHNRVYVYTQIEKQAHWLDELLWTFKEDSFIPHNLQGEGPFPPPVVQIGQAQPDKIFNDIIINLDINIPAFCQQFRRIIEIIPEIAEIKQAARTRYRLYQQQQYAINTHQM